VILYPTPITASADPRREMPAGAGSRHDGIDAALATLAAEEQRLARLGLELPMARCREQRRYWNFLRALHALPEVSPVRRPNPGDFTWPGERSR
jgi:hypothetical protein